MMRMLSESDRLDSGSAASSSSTKKRRIASSTSSSSSDTRDRARSRSVVRMEAGHTREKGSSRIGETGGPTGADMPGSSSRTEKSANKYRAYMHQANSLMPRRVDTAPTRLLQQVFISGEEIQVPALLQIITIVRTTPDREVGKFSLLLSTYLSLSSHFLSVLNLSHGETWAEVTTLKNKAKMFDRQVPSIYKI